MLILFILWLTFFFPLGRAGCSKNKLCLLLFGAGMQMFFEFFDRLRSCPSHIYYVY